MSELIVYQDGGERRLTAAEFQHLAAVPAAVEWFGNIDSYAWAPRSNTLNNAPKTPAVSLEPCEKK